MAEEALSPAQLRRILENGGMSEDMPEEESSLSSDELAAVIEASKVVTTAMADMAETTKTMISEQTVTNQELVASVAELLRTNNTAQMIIENDQNKRKEKIRFVVKRDEFGHMKYVDVERR